MPRIFARVPSYCKSISRNWACGVVNRRLGGLERHISIFSNISNCIINAYYLRELGVFFFDAEAPCYGTANPSDHFFGCLYVKQPMPQSICAYVCAYVCFGPYACLLPGV